MGQALLWVLGPTHERSHCGAYIAQWGWGGWGPWWGTVWAVEASRGQAGIIMHTFCARYSARQWGCVAISAFMPVCWGVRAVRVAFLKRDISQLSPGSGESGGVSSGQQEWWTQSSGGQRGPKGFWKVRGERSRRQMGDGHIPGT